MPAEAEYLQQDKTLKSSKSFKAMAVRAYKDQKKPDIDNDQISSYIPMVHAIVQRVVTYLRPPLTFEDLVSAGMIGLLKAARNYDPAQQAEFKTYAYIKIKGAVLDELKGWSFVSADLNKRIGKISKLKQQITQKTGTAPTDEYLAQKLGISVEKLYQTYEDARAQNFVSIDEGSEESPSLGSFLAAATSSPDQPLQKSELLAKLTQAIQQLPQRQRRLIVLYYTQNLTMKQIAEVFEITESRVSQLHASALFNLSVKLKEWKND